MDSELGECEEKLSPTDSTSGLHASEAFVQALANQVNRQDTKAMIESQKIMLQRFEKTNEMLVNCNALSAARLQSASQEFRRHTDLLNTMRKDLNLIFKRIRSCKSRLTAQYPEAFAVCSDNFKVVDEEDDDDNEKKDRATVGVHEQETPGQPPPENHLNSI